MQNKTLKRRFGFRSKTNRILNSKRRKNRHSLSI